MREAPLELEIVHRLKGRVNDKELLAEVEDLARTIARTRSELQRLDAGPFIAGHIPAATDELDAVVAHTASATDVILEACEQLETASANGEPINADMLGKATTAIYEACSFQDITGQRIKKVVGTLKAIEQKVGEILHVFGQGQEFTEETVPMETLTNGPQLPGKAMEQSDIDKLLADF
jgi:chemotaxis protein CheZ